MSVGEFDLIKRYFKQKTSLDESQSVASGVNVGIGDDCAILDIPDGYQLVVTTDSLVSGVHFFEDVCPYRLGYKSLAVNLSDLAAMGATPKWLSLAITLPNVDEQWLSEFSRGFFELANKYNVKLIGGDTTKGPLSITVSAKGIVPRNRALLRSGAQVGDLICVSGCLGDGALGLACKLGNQSVDNKSAFINALELTDPRNELGILLADYASSCIDISDGLVQDLQHILDASRCGAILAIDKLPLSQAMQLERNKQTLTVEQILQYALTGGDDYELLFTISKRAYKQLCMHKAETTFSVVGEIVKDVEMKLKLTNGGQAVTAQYAGWDHFK